MRHLCRNCACWLPPGTLECDRCGATRFVSHAQLQVLTIAHLDCDAFFANIEKRDHPDLVHKPVVIGGGKRGVVSTACYRARQYGIRSAMPIYKARKLCPSAVFIRPDMDKYKRVGLQIRALMAQAAECIEPISIDEAFLKFPDQSPVPAAERLVRLVNRIRAETGLSVSVGLSYNKFLAKVASDLEKPSGYSVIAQTEAVSFLAQQPTRLLWGVGEKLAARLARDGIYKIGQIQRIAEAELMARYGSIGRRLARLSHGIDSRSIGETSERKSISTETTLVSNEAEFEPLWHLLERRAALLQRDLEHKQVAAGTLTLKLKTADFKIVTRQIRLTTPTTRAEVMRVAMRPVLKRMVDGTSYRLIGLSASQLIGIERADPVDLFSWRMQKASNLHHRQNRR